MNNRYYANIVIDNETLQSLPEDGTIDDYLPHVLRNEDHLNNDQNDNEDMGKKQENDRSHKARIILLIT